MKFKFIILIIFFIIFLPRSINSEDTEKINEPPRFEYSNKEEFITSLKNCISHLNTYTPQSEQVNTELIITQAVIESNYGESRFAREGHNLFGIRTWSKNGMLPLKQPETIPWRVKIFKNKCESVKYYVEILNTREVFKKFRDERTYQKNNNIYITARYFNKLDKYATNPNYHNLLMKVYFKIYEAK